MSKNTILIADDDRDLLKIEESFLTRAGYRVLCAQDAYRAVHLALSEAPNLLLLDVNMPAGNGLSVHERIRNAPALRDTPVIYLTGQRSDAILKRAKDMNAFSVMYKPFDYDVLLTTVKAAILEADARHAQARPTAEFQTHAAWAVQQTPA